MVLQNVALFLLAMAERSVVSSLCSGSEPVDYSLDLMIILDSSGSVYDAGYDNWQSELDFAKAVVNTSLPPDSRIGLINFAGCGSNKDFAECVDNGKLVTEWGLSEYGDPNDQQAVYDRIAQMNSSDFLSGYTWTNEALYLALSEFQNGTNDSFADRTKVIILVTDGEPYPHDIDPPHEPCITSTGFESSTLANLRALDTVILTVGIAVDDAAVDEYLLCIPEDTEEHYFDAANFTALQNVANEVGSIITCLGITQSPTVAPSPYPTLQPTVPTLQPTIEPSAPTLVPSHGPTLMPTTTADPTNAPTATPTNDPTSPPSTVPSQSPSIDPTSDPTNAPTAIPTTMPTEDESQLSSTSDSMIPTQISNGKTMWQDAYLTPIYLSVVNLVFLYLH